MKLLKDLYSKCKTKITGFMLTCATVAGFAMVPSASITINDSIDMSSANDLVGTMLGVIVKMALYVGILLAAWGIFQLVMAFKNEDADSKSRAIMVIVMSIILIGLSPILQTFLNSISL